MGLEPHTCGCFCRKPAGDKFCTRFLYRKHLSYFFFFAKKGGNRDEAGISLWHPNEVLSVPGILWMRPPLHLPQGDLPPCSQH